MQIISDHACSSIYKLVSGKVVTIIIVALIALAGTAAGFEQYSALAEANEKTIQLVEEND